MYCGLKNKNIKINKNKNNYSIILIEKIILRSALLLPVPAIV